MKQSAGKVATPRGHGSDSRPAIDERAKSASTREQLEREKTALEKENADLHQVNRYRSILLARLAHELRTPLTSILGFSEILLNQEKLTEPQKNFCERIQNSAQQLQWSLNQLTDLARLEAGRRELRAEEFSIDDLLRESCAELARKTRKQKAELRWDAADGLPMIVSDRVKLRQILSSFLDYMLSRSPEGALVKATAEVTSDGFVLKVEDEGEPIADTTEIGFLDMAEQRSTTSVDLGLAIARQHIDLLSGKLSVNNHPGGVEVVLSFPSVMPDTEPLKRNLRAREHKHA